MAWDRARWRADETGLALGHELFDALAPAARPAWAATVLERAATAVAPVREVEDVLRVAETPARWGEGHVAFRHVRELTIAAERTHRGHPLYRALLGLAETTAKIAYNASGRPAPFDHRAGWRLARDARRVAELAGDEELADRLWQALARAGP